MKDNCRKFSHLRIEYFIDSKSSISALQLCFLELVHAEGVTFLKKIAVNWWPTQGLKWRVVMQWNESLTKLLQSLGLSARTR